MLPATVRDEIERIGRDRESGATTLVLKGVALLRAVSGDSAVLRAAARELCRCQPSMAGFRTAAAVARSADDPTRALERLEQRLARAVAAIVRYAVPVLRLRPHSGPLHVVTCSRSASVEQVLVALQREESVRVSCSESRPAREGAGLARSLAARGVEVNLYTDAGVGAAIPDADALVVGADAVTTSRFLNKVGTAGLAALARAVRVPVMVLAGREKLLPEHVYAELALGHGPASEVGADLPESVRVHNPLFEHVPADFASHLITDGGAVEWSAIGRAGMWRDGFGVI